MNKKHLIGAGALAVAAVGAADQFAGTNLRGKVGLGMLSPWLLIAVGAAALYYAKKA